jgi:hypothetical protein
MGLFKSKVEGLTTQIKKENLSLLDETERGSEYYLNKLLAWQEDFYDVEWDEFYDKYLYCDHCKDWSEGQCICYAR